MHLAARPHPPTTTHAVPREFLLNFRRRLRCMWQRLVLCARVVLVHPHHWRMPGDCHVRGGVLSDVVNDLQPLQRWIVQLRGRDGVLELCAWFAQR